MSFNAGRAAEARSKAASRVLPEIKESCWRVGNRLGQRNRDGVGIGIVLHKSRLLAGLTLREAEKLTGISNSYLSQMESGYIREPSPFMLKKLSTAYKVSYGRLFDAVGYPRP